MTFIALPKGAAVESSECTVLGSARVSHEYADALNASSRL